MGQRKHFVAVGAHCGDVEIQAGAIAHKYARAGWDVTFLHLTAGEKGNPQHVTVEDYRRQKIEEAEKVAHILGGSSITLDYKDAELAFNDDIVTHVATLMRKLRPTVVVTHWVNSIHPDHVLCQRIVEAAQLKAGLPGFDLDGLAPHYYPFYHSENWEDMEDYDPDIYVDVSDEFETYLEALANYWFIMNSSSFRYFDYYKALGTVRGCVGRVTYAQTLKYPAGGNVRKSGFIPGHEF
ncbi:PIG-L family deacetylase [Bacillaceae bacterium SIJ1]|uniref:PIG-L deacetylase family protein n=1 Tax=Litoribacterium kuwaitense TaxID=1398745 RepID=UPI0013EBCABA|nr:PIG-L family deacetylase [Litoribacterium kuwaitense]NGP46188.1 PIG-L family deacetylase [Litoribacterium kuwaitense]